MSMQKSIMTVISAQCVSVCFHMCVCVCVSLYSQQYLCDLTDIIIHIVAVGKQDVLIKLRAIMKCLEAYVLCPS